MPRFPTPRITRVTDLRTGRTIPVPTWTQAARHWTRAVYVEYMFSIGRAARIERPTITH